MIKESWKKLKSLNQDAAKKEVVIISLCATIVAVLIFMVLRITHASVVATLLMMFCLGVAFAFIMFTKSRQDRHHMLKILESAEEARHQARLQSEMTSRSRMEFLANMSHDLRTPLNAVIGFSEILKNEVMGPLGVPAYKEYAQNIYDSGHYLLKIISEILEVSKIETGNRELLSSNFKLTKPLNVCTMILAPRIEEAGLTLKVSIPADLPEILGDLLAIKQILLNLISNAIKFTPRGGTIEVKAEIDPANGSLFIDVIDTGVGMTAQEIEGVMRPFGKVDNSHQRSMQTGMGMGLTMVDSLVRLHSGQLRLASQKGIGTTAQVILPASRVLMTEGARKTSEG